MNLLSSDAIAIRLDYAFSCPNTPHGTGASANASASEGVKNGIPSEAWRLATDYYWRKAGAGGCAGALYKQCCWLHTTPRSRDRRKRAWGRKVHQFKQPNQNQNAKRGGTTTFQQHKYCLLKQHSRVVWSDGYSRSSTSDLSNCCCGNEAMGDRER